ncbi:MAG: YIP1 family protein [Haloferacaceae archaeon]
MTTWADDAGGGRARGPSGLLRAWVEVLVRPRRFFRTAVVPGQQAPGLVFAVAVALAYLAGLLGSGAETVPPTLPVVGGTGPLAAAFVVLLVALVVAPATLHLTAAVCTLGLMATVEDRAGVSETVQTVAYAAAPCALAGLPVPEVRAFCALYGTALLVLGLGEVHDTGPVRAALAGAVPAGLVFGAAFRGFGAVAVLLPALGGA